MSAFKFRLEKVLEYRRQLEDQAKQELAQALEAADKTKKNLLQLQTAMREEQVMLAKPECLDSAERWLRQSYENALRSDIAETEQLLHLQEEEVDRCRQELIVKAQERELLEKLKDKQAARHYREELQKEQRAYDETATLRFKPASF